MGVACRGSYLANLIITVAVIIIPHAIVGDIAVCIEFNYFVCASSGPTSWVVIVVGKYQLVIVIMQP